ncbi:MAG: sigma-70 family RNA polymerase sigma factor, partial [Bacillota bacterium]
SQGNDESTWFERIALKEVLAQLPEKHRQILLLRFFQDKTQTEIADVVGLSQVQVSRIERQALQKIRELLGNQEQEVSKP